MKRILQYVAGIGLVVVLGYGVINHSSTEVYEPVEEPTVNEVPEPTPEELMEQATQKLIAQAIAASSTEIETAKEEAAKSVEDEMKLKIEKKVRDDIATSNDRRQQEIEEELSF